MSFRVWRSRQQVAFARPLNALAAERDALKEKLETQQSTSHSADNSAGNWSGRHQSFELRFSIDARFERALTINIWMPADVYIEGYAHRSWRYRRIAKMDLNRQSQEVEFS